jgi:single-stranded-DNA-specific exonuclease
VTPILPHRLRDGYGFQGVHVERARQEGCSLIVTADCGTTAFEPVRQARRLGLPVIVTDHHLPAEEGLPEAVLINPQRPGSTYPYPFLSGAGLAFKLALAVAARAGRPLPLAPLLRVTCLGTIADLVPLTGENRAIAALGLSALADTRSPGLKALFRHAALVPPISASDVGFRIGPRINAAGRLDDAHRALELLLTRDVGRADGLAAQLEGFNRDRQEEEERVVAEAREVLSARSPGGRIGVAWSPGWHPGVVGIAAGRLARELHRPVLLLAVGGERATGSGRSIPGLDLHGFLVRWSPRLERFGGHAQAVGLAVRCAELEDLHGEWEEAAAAWPEELLVRRFEYELEVDATTCNAGLLATLDRLEPHGPGNPRPLVKTGPLVLVAAPRLFGRGHLSALAEDGGGRLRLLGWRWAERASELAGRFEALGYVERDSYTGGTLLRLMDVRPLGPRPVLPPDPLAGP